jgi:6-phosphofructokinase 1
MSVPRRLGILTAGGDCPGLNAVIRAVVKSAVRSDPPIEVVGIRDGYAGLVLGKTRVLRDADVSGILTRGGTILGSSNRDNPFRFIAKAGDKPVDRSKDAIATFEREKLDGLICVGGDGTLRGALAFQKLGIPVIGVPKTIDNDLSGTDVTFGFDSAHTLATYAVDRLHTTAESHHRVLICEVMGRNAGWIALYAGVAGGGDVILIPEIPYQLEKIAEHVKRREAQGKTFSIIVAAEGAAPQGGGRVASGKYKDAEQRERLGGVSHVVAQGIEKLTDYEARVVILGHLQRGGTPTSLDRWLATHYGAMALQLAAQRKWGRMAALRGTTFTSVTIEEAVATSRRVDPQCAEVAAARGVGTSFGD